jgi:hypothetical protein
MDTHQMTLGCTSRWPLAMANTQTSNSFILSRWKIASSDRQQFRVDRSATIRYQSRYQVAAWLLGSMVRPPSFIFLACLAYSWARWGWRLFPVIDLILSTLVEHPPGKISSIIYFAFSARDSSAHIIFCLMFILLGVRGYFKDLTTNLPSNDFFLRPDEKRQLEFVLRDQDHDDLAQNLESRMVVRTLWDNQHPSKWTLEWNTILLSIYLALSGPNPLFLNHLVPTCSNPTN